MEFLFFFLKSLVVKEIVLYLHSQKRSKLFKTYNIKNQRMWCNW